MQMYLQNRDNSGNQSRLPTVITCYSCGNMSNLGHLKGPVLVPHHSAVDFTSSTIGGFDQNKSSASNTDGLIPMEMKITSLGLAEDGSHLEEQG